MSIIIRYYSVLNLEQLHLMRTNIQLIYLIRYIQENGSPISAKSNRNFLLAWPKKWVDRKKQTREQVAN